MKTEKNQSDSVKQESSNLNLFRGLLLSVLVLLFMGVYTYIYEYSPFLQHHFKQINSLAITKYSLKRSLKNNDYHIAANRLKQLHLLKKQKLVEDSINKIQNYDGGQKGLLRFMNALYQVESKKKGTCRIAYFGDSMIEGDLMSMSLRENLQEKYGGLGVGFVPITSNTNDFRISIRHEFSASWKKENLLNVSNLKYPLGISGEYFIPATSTAENTVIYSARNRKFVGKFPVTKLFYGKPKTESGINSLVFNNTPFELKGTSSVNTMVLSRKSIKTAKLNFRVKSELPIYGLSFESDYGVLLDNLPIRGNSGIPMTAIKSSILKSFNKELDYDLIILQFGLNVVSKQTNFSWYKIKMKRVINHFRTSLPNASILIVSVPDVSEKNDKGQMQTALAIPSIVEAQKSAAMQTGVSFFNLYKAMGEKNSMVKWVEELKYANKDYTHFNYKGAQYASEIIFKFLDERYINYKKTKSIE